MMLDSEDTGSCKTTQIFIRVLNVAIPSVWVILGTITNCISLIVFSRKQMKQNSTFFYLALMTMSDLIGNCEIFN